MQTLVYPISTSLSPESLARALAAADQPVLLRSGGSVSPLSRYSLLAAFPMLTFESRGARCEWHSDNDSQSIPQFGNPWSLLKEQLVRYEIIDEPDVPYPTGGCFGYWGYDLKQFVEPRVNRSALNDLDLPDCRAGFYPSLVVWDRILDRAWIVATGLSADGTRTGRSAQQQVDRWLNLIDRATNDSQRLAAISLAETVHPKSCLSRDQFVEAVRSALDYIRRGHVYQVNLSQRWSRTLTLDPWQLFEVLSTLSPAPFSGLQRWNNMAVISSSPEQFLHLSGNEIVTRPIKGTRPRSIDPDEDARLSYELQASEKERAELVMITDLLRNDLGRVCEFGSVQVPELMKLERYSHVQHLVSTVGGRLRSGTSHLDAFAACFPGGSITGAPKIRAMQIIDELEPVARGPYTGCLGYLGFNRESQLNILIRTAVMTDHTVHYHAGAGIVADSDPEAEFEETLVKARAFFQSLGAHAEKRSTNNSESSA